MSVKTIPKIAIKNYDAKWPQKVNCHLYKVCKGVWHIQIDLGFREVEWAATASGEDGQIFFYFNSTTKNKQTKDATLLVSIDFGPSCDYFMEFGNISKDTFFGTIYHKTVYKKLFSKRVASIIRYTPRLSNIKIK